MNAGVDSGALGTSGLGVKPQTDAELAKLLGLDKAQVCRLKRRGMPTESVEAAQAWRAEHVRMRVQLPREGRDADAAAAALAMCSRMLKAAEAALGAGVLQPMLPAVRSALRNVPLPQRRTVPISLPLWDALCETALAGAEAGAQLAWLARRPLPNDEDHDDFFYAMACGELVPADQVPVAAN